MVGGVPVGDDAYVDEAVRVVGEGVESYIDTTVTQLHSHPHHLAASMYHAAQHRFMYWLRHLPPRHTLATAQPRAKYIYRRPGRLAIGCVHSYPAPQGQRRLRITLEAIISRAVTSGTRTVPT